MAAVILVAVASAHSLEAQARQIEPTAEGRSVTQWLAVLGTDDTANKQKALAAIKSMGTAAAPALRSAAAGDANKSVRFFAIDLLGGLGGREVAAVLATAVERDPDSLNQYAAAASLDKLTRRGDADAAAAVARLLSAFAARLEDPSASREASDLLNAFGESARPTLIKAATHRSPGVRAEAVLALANLRGPGVRAALVERHGDPDREVRSASATALAILVKVERADLPSVLPALLAAVRDRDLSVQVSAIGALGSIGPPARGAIQALRGLLGDKERREAAVLALIEIDPVGTAGQTVPVLIELLQDPTSATRSSVPDTLGGLGPAAAAAIPALTAALKDPDEFVRTSAAAALAKIRAVPPR